jgi:predicted MFS family arabinose efflux permease
VILILTLSLLEFIGYGEAKRKYTQFQLTRLATQGEIIRYNFVPYLQAGLPLKQFGGFSSQSERLLLSDDSIQAIQVTDTKGNLVFLNGQKDRDLTPAKLKEKLENRRYIASHFKLEGNKLVEESQDSFRVILPLDTRFGVVGYVAIESERGALLQVLDEQFRYVFYAFLSLTLIFILLVIVYEIYFADPKTREKFLKTTYIIEFLVMSILISAVIFKTYEYGARASTKALSNSMAQRLSAVLELNIYIEDVSGINQAFKDYQKNNSQINQIALTRDNIVIFHTDEQELGKPYHSPSNSFEYIVPLGNGQNNHIFRVAVSIPIKVVMSAIWSSAKAFIVLFVACGFISFIFLDAGTALLTVRKKHEIVVVQTGTKANNLPLNGDEDTSFQIGLRLIKPAYFLIVFVSALSVSFLPQLAASMAKMSGSTLASASLPFSIFYTCFALVLIPAGYYAERGNLKKLLAFGFIAEMIGLTLIATTENFWILTLSRIFSGTGQGVFLIGLQSYILVITPTDKQTQGGAVKVTGRNAGMIAGTSIGALLFVYLSYHILFMIASLLTLLATIYLWILVPSVEEITRRPLKVKKAEPLSLLQFMQVFRDFEFMNTLVLIGLTSKIAIAGVIMFAVPLVLSEKGFASEDIGLGLMLFYIFSTLITHYVSRLVDKLGQTRQVLSLSSIIGGVGVLMLGLLGAGLWRGENFHGVPLLNSMTVSFNELIVTLGLLHYEDYLIFLFLILAGISNGMSTAPVLTHINKTEVAERYGSKSVSATYTFLERGGHILGPIVVSQLFVFSHHSTLGLALFGIVMIVSAFLFQVLSNKK